MYARSAGLDKFSRVGGESELLDLVRLKPLMALTNGRPEIVIGLMDGPVDRAHRQLAHANIQEVAATGDSMCRDADNVACQHGTFIAGMLMARGGMAMPAICPDCTLLVRPIFREEFRGATLPSSTPDELAAAIIDCIDSGARVLNISGALAQPSTRGERRLEDALDHASHRGIIVIAAAGNQSHFGSSPITRHPWVIPVAACDKRGRPAHYSNLGPSIGRRGLSAPGEGITSLTRYGTTTLLGGTSIATPFVTGVAALLWSQFPTSNAAQIKYALTGTTSARRARVVPPLLDAWAAYRAMLMMNPHSSN